MIGCCSLDMMPNSGRFQQLVLVFCPEGTQMKPAFHNSVWPPTCLVPLLQDLSLLQVLQASAASRDDIFLVNFGRWHFNNCKGIQADTYMQSLTELGLFYNVRGAVHM
jgi:hypothetical protein